MISRGRTFASGLQERDFDQDCGGNRHRHREIEENNVSPRVAGDEGEEAVLVAVAGQQVMSADQHGERVQREAVVEVGTDGVEHVVGGEGLPEQPLCHPIRGRRRRVCGGGGR